MKSVFLVMTLLLSLLRFQTDDVPTYVRVGEKVEAEFSVYRDDLAGFFQNLRTTVQREMPASEAPGVMRQLQDPPPQTGVFGYQMLPRIVEPPQTQDSNPVTSFNYSWPITQGYIAGERIKLDRARAGLVRAVEAEPEAKAGLFAGLAREYRELVRNQRTIDQYIQYNRFWQRSIAQDRPRFDQLTLLYELVKSGSPDTAEAIRQVLGRPLAPRFIRVNAGAGRILLTVPVYTDIADDTFLLQAKNVIEEFWRASEDGVEYSVELDLRRRAPASLYSTGAPRQGEHIDVRKHAALFPEDGGVLTSGAEFTYGAVGRYVALGPGDLTPRTLAHEFGHLLGFNDGYIRGYKDLNADGFEILELTSSFNDIMSAPREGRVQATHFKLLLEALSPDAR